jgi:uncharacterized protein (DUF362 family)
MARALCAAAALFSTAHLGAQTPSPAKPPPPIYSITDPSMIDGFTPRPDQIRKNFDLLLASAAGTSDPAAAWSRWIKPGQRIGIKISAMPGKIMGTRPALVDAIVASLIRAGHSPSNILIFDRYNVEMRDAGWGLTPRSDRVKVTAVWPQEGYDPNVVYHCPYAGRLIWGDFEFKGQVWNVNSDEDQGQLSSKSYFTKIVTQKVDVLIDVPSLTTRDGIGVFGSIANLPLGVIDNQRRFFKPFFGREENIADLATHKSIQGKWVLTIMDSLLGQYAGGPAFDPKYVWAQASLWLSEDPVALDSLALKLINERRPTNNIRAIDSDDTAYLQSCQDAGLGSTDLSGNRLREIALPVFVGE